jgi:hypothetical protein
MKRNMTVCLVVLSFPAILAMLIACAPPVRRSDAGEYAFARQVAPKIYGRKAKGYDEVKLIGDLSALIGREATVRAMMAQTEFVDHWTEHFVDRMRVHREGPKAQTTCFAETVETAGNDPRLAAWIRDQFAFGSGPAMCGGAPCGTFTMTDVIRSALLLDDLSPAYRAYLFPLVNKPPTGNEIDEANKRDELFSTFETVYLTRKNSCLTCHNSAFSLSGPESYWNRTHPIWGLWEKAVYGAHVGREPRELHSVFRTDIRSGSLQPWGMSSACGSFRTSIPNDTLLQTGEEAYLSGSHGRQGSVFGVDIQLAFGVYKISTDDVQRFVSDETRQSCNLCGSCTVSTEPSLTPTQQMQEAEAGSVITARCATSGCHASNAGGLTMTSSDWKSNLVRVASTQMPSLARVKPGDSGNSYVARKITGMPASGTGSMPPGGMPDADRDRILAWIDGVPTDAGCGTCQVQPVACDGFPREVDSEEAMAFLVGQTVVNDAWTEVMGYPLVIDNYFSRNEGQRNLLWNLTEFNFLNNDWSLRDVLARIFTFNYYNRRPPSAGDGSTPYELPMFFDPWVEGDPRVPPQALDGWTPGSATAPTPDPSYVAANNPHRHKNAMSEAVHRYSARNLLNSVSRALDWPRPRRFPSETQYPTKELATSIGQFIKDAEPGFRGTDLQGLLTWESVHGVCQKPAGVAEDWIDRALVAVAAYDAAHPGAPASVADVVQTVKDWFINYAGISTAPPGGLTASEQQALADHFGVLNLNASANTVADLQGKVRAYCGVLLETPQFMLAGIAPEDLGPRPKIRACNDGNCSYEQLCRQLEPAIEAQGIPIVCRTDSVARGVEAGFVLPEDIVEIADVFCARHQCTLIEPNERCRLNPKLCPVAPACNPEIDGCGGPLPPIELARGLLNGKILVAQIAGERITAANNVDVIRGLRRVAAPLESGVRLSEGDLLLIRPRGMLETDGRRFRAPSGKLRWRLDRKESEDDVATQSQNALMIRVAGPDTMLARPSEDYVIPPPLRLIEQLQAGAWLMHGSASRVRDDRDAVDREALIERRKAFHGQASGQEPGGIDEQRKQ